VQLALEHGSTSDSSQAAECALSGAAGALNLPGSHANIGRAK